MDASTKDSSGTVLAEGDALTLPKALKVKGSLQTPRRGPLVRNSRSSSPAEGEGRAGGSAMVLKTEFSKQA